MFDDPAPHATIKRVRTSLAALILLAACKGPLRIDYEAEVGRPASPEDDRNQPLPIGRFAKAERGSIERQLFERLTAAVEYANRFIGSEWNHFFPKGRSFRIDSQRGRLRLDSVAGDGFEMTISVTCLGTLANSAGYSAMESWDGFQVGRCRDVHGRPVDAAIANSMWFGLDGQWRDPEMIAAMLLHETSHTLQVRAQGQLSYWLEYYFRAALLGQGGEEENDLEKVPYRVESEFWRWFAARQ
jgi:hypothetical protein